MNEIKDVGSVVRQVQPRDFSFLSEASQEIVEVIYGILFSMGAIYGDLGNTYPVILSGCTKTIDSGTLTMSEGFAMYKKRIYKIPAYTGNNAIKFLFKNELVVVSPSPVKDVTLANTIDCHYNTQAVVQLRNDVSLLDEDYFVHYEDPGQDLKRVKAFQTI